MSNKTEKSAALDILSELAFPEKDQTKFGALVLSIVNPLIREEFAKVIKARASQDAVVGLVLVIASEAPDKLAGALKAFSLTNASALRQALEKSFTMPISGKGSVERSNSRSK